jgi:hypothetical protein
MPVAEGRRKRDPGPLHAPRRVANGGPHRLRARLVVPGLCVLQSEADAAQATAGRVRAAAGHLAAVVRRAGGGDSLAPLAQRTRSLHSLNGTRRCAPRGTRSLRSLDGLGASRLDGLARSTRSRDSALRASRDSLAPLAQRDSALRASRDSLAPLARRTLALRALEGLAAPRLDGRAPFTRAMGFGAPRHERLPG